MELFECTRLRANISKRQCEINRNGLKGRGVSMAPIATCQGCAGLGSSAHVTLPMEEANVKKTLKHIYCGHKGCYVIVKKEGDFCKKHQGLEDQVAAGTVQADHPEEKSEMVAPSQEGEGAAETAVPQRLLEIDAGSICAVCVGDCNAGPTPCQPGTHKVCVNFVPWRRDDERTQAMLSLVGLAISLEVLKQQTDQNVMSAEFYAGALHLQASDNDDVQVPPMPFFLKGCQSAIPSNAEISSVTPHPPQEHADPLALPSSPATEGTKGLAALLRAPAPLPVGLFIPFASDELAALEESEVTPEVIREFVIMGLEGKLQPVAA